MNNVINTRIEQLRELMRREKLSAFVFPSTDPHHSEYVCDHWKGREWISGFNGSAGTAVITMTSAALWTDSRYFLAAAEQLKGTEYQLMKMKMPGTPSITQWLAKELDGVQSPEVGVDGMVSSNAFVENMIKELRESAGITVRTNLDPLRLIWKDRPVIPLNKVELQPLEYAGEPTQSKLSRIRQALRENHADGILVAALDDIAWTLNLRGTDVHCNPVFVAYLLISSDAATLYINNVKLTPEVSAYLEEEHIAVDDYENVRQGLKDYFEYNIQLDPNEINYTLFHTPTREVVRAQSPIPEMKSHKNETEIRGFRNAMLKDGIAMVKFLKWLKPAVEAGGQTEISLDRKLTGLRSEQPLFRDISFDTIAGYQEHSAVVHYEATPETDVPVSPEGLILIDSGAQYQDGTTDLTRTIALGPITEEMKHIYTLVLKSHIQFELVKFPDGACGTQLDAAGRECLWREGLNFLHGTGHGVGSYLNVHEGPHQIRMEYYPTPLRSGMTVTDEPGIYLAGKFGVRIENVLLIEPYLETEFGKFLQMTPLTLCPIDTTPIDRSLLSQVEFECLNQYHSWVYRELAPHLSPDEQDWLKEATRPI